MTSKSSIQDSEFRIQNKGKTRFLLTPGVGRRVASRLSHLFAIHFSFFIFHFSFFKPGLPTPPLPGCPSGCRRSGWPNSKPCTGNNSFPS